MSFGMSATLSDVAAAAAQLGTAKRRISVRSIREVLGGGSPNHLTKLVSQWRQSTVQFPANSTAPAHMIAEVANVAPRIWELALQEANAHVQNNIDQLTLALQNAIDDNEEIQVLFDQSVAHLDQAREEQRRALSVAEDSRARCSLLDSQLAQQASLFVESQAALQRQQLITEQLTEKTKALESAIESERSRQESERIQSIRAIAELETKLAVLTAKHAISLEQHQRTSNDIREAELKEQKSTELINQLRRQLDVSNEAKASLEISFKEAGQESESHKRNLEQHIIFLENEFAVQAQKYVAFREAMEGSLSLQAQANQLIIDKLDGINVLINTRESAPPPAE